MDFLLHSLTSAAVVTALLAALGWLFRAFIGTRLRAAVEHEFGAKMAAIQSELRQSEERFKADLKGKEAAIQALQSGALSGQTNRQVANGKRRLEAIDELWSAMTALRPAILNTRLWGKFDYKKCMAEAAANPKFREMWGVFSSGAKEAVDNRRGDEARPHVTKLAWAYFEAYRATVVFYTIRVVQLHHGMAEDFTNHEDVKKVLLTALPHHADAVSKLGVDHLYLYLDELEDKLLNEFTAMLAGHEADVESVHLAAQILEVVSQVERGNTSQSEAMVSMLNEVDIDAGTATTSIARPVDARPA